MSSYREPNVRVVPGQQFWFSNEVLLMYVSGVPLIIVIIVISVDKNNYGLIAFGKYVDGSTDDL